METKNKVIILIAIVIILGFGFVATSKYITKTTGYGVSEEESVIIAQCLKNKGVIMYGTDSCVHCKEQKKQLGSAFRFINYVACEENPDACASLEGVPAWQINGEMHYGVQEIETLAELAGC